ALGQAGFCMVGGYASAILCVNHHWDPLAALLAGALVAMATAWAIAAPILKLRGFVLAMASLALHLILIVVALELPFTGGALGTYGVPKFALFGLPLGSDLAFYYVVWLIVLAFVAAGLAIDRSRVGRALKALAASETAALSAGIDITRYKLQMFVVSAGMASVCGSLAVHYLRAMDPNVFGFAFSLNFITAVIVGGLMSVWGGVVGAAIVTGLREILRGLSLPLWEGVIMGVLTVVVLIALRRGQDHALQPHRRLPAARCRQHRPGRRAHRRPAAEPDRRSRRRPDLPEPAALRQHDRARERHVRHPPPLPGRAGQPRENRRGARLRRPARRGTAAPGRAVVRPPAPGGGRSRARARAALAAHGRAGLGPERLRDRAPRRADPARRGARRHRAARRAR